MMGWFRRIAASLLLWWVVAVAALVKGDDEEENLTTTLGRLRKTELLGEDDSLLSSILLLSSSSFSRRQLRLKQSRTTPNDSTPQANPPPPPQEQNVAEDEFWNSGVFIENEFKSLTPRPTKKPAPKPTFRPTPKPAPDTPRPTFRPTPRPAPDTPRPSPRPTPRPAPDTPRPSPRPTPRPAPDTPRPSPRPTPRPIKDTEPPTAAPTKIDTADRTIFDIIQDRNRLSVLESAIVAADLEEAFRTLDPLTVFAPNNAAFERLGEDYTDKLITNPEFGLHLTSLLLNHGTNVARYLSDDLTNGLELDMLGMETVTVNANGDTLLETEAAVAGLADPVRIVQADSVAINGVLHEVRDVLSPLWYYLNLIDLLQVFEDEFSTLRSLLDAAGLQDEIANSVDTTLLAPTNAAFDALPDSVLEFLTDPDNVDELRNVLLYHFIPSTVVNFDILPVGRTRQETAQGGNVVIRIEEGDDGRDVFFNDEPSPRFFLSKDSIAYQLDAVLIPPNMMTPTRSPATTPTPDSDQTLFDIISETDDLSTLSSALVIAGLDEPLSDAEGGPFTVFAPNNSAFQNSLDDDYLQKLLTPGYDLHLNNLLLYHVDSGELRSDDLVDGLELSMANGMMLTVQRDDANNIQLVTPSADAGNVPTTNVIDADTAAVNGILHGVDSVLLPSWYFSDPLSAITALDDTFSTLDSLITAANYEDKFTSLVDATILAPNNAAFAALPQATLDYLTNPANVDILQQVLDYHVIPDEVLAFTTLDFGTYEYPTLQGESVTVEVTESPSGGKVIRFNGFPATGAGFYLVKDDLIYEIAGVLFPESLESVIPQATSVTPKTGSDSDGNFIMTKSVTVPGNRKR